MSAVPRRIRIVFTDSVTGTTYTLFATAITSIAPGQPIAINPANITIAATVFD